MKFPRLLIAFILPSSDGLAQIDFGALIAKNGYTVIDSIAKRMDSLLPQKPSRVIDTIEIFKDSKGLPDSASCKIFYYHAFDNQISRITENFKSHIWTTDITIYYYRKKTIRYEVIVKKSGNYFSSYTLYFFNDKLIYKIGLRFPRNPTSLEHSYKLLNR